MTISTEVRTAGPFVGNGTTTEFAFTFKVFSTSEVVIVQIDSDGEQETLTQGSNLVVALNADQDNDPGGTVTYTPAGVPMTSDYSLFITADVDATQTLDIVNNDGFFPRLITRALDKLTILVQQVLSRGLLVPAGDKASGSTTLPDDRANKYLAFDLNKEPVAVEGTGTTTDAQLVTYTLNATGAMQQSLVDWFKDRVSVRSFTGVDDTGATDSTVGFANARAAALLLKRKLFIPGGAYLLNGATAGPDGYKNGLLIPHGGVVNTDYSNALEIYGDPGKTRILAGSNNMVLFRLSRPYSKVRGINFEANGKTGCIGIGILPEDMSQYATAVSQSECLVSECYIESFTEGMKFQPGPSVGGSDSGCFYHTIEKCTFNLNSRAVHMVKDTTSSGAATGTNRTTRTDLIKCTFLRGNTGVQIDGGTEIDFYGCHFELIATGTSPNATPRAFFYNDTNPAVINLFGGYAEACTKGVMAVSGSEAFVNLAGFEETGTPDASRALMNRSVPGAMTISKPYSNAPVYLSFGNASFVGFVVDPDGTDSKTVDLTINGASKIRWASTGKETFYGTSGNIEYAAAGNDIKFTYNGTNSITCNGASSVLSATAAQHSWSTVAAGQIVTMSAAEFIPRADNTTSFGVNGLRWSAIWAANGTIQTSDPRTKYDVKDSELGLDFIMKLRPVSYKYLVGANEITGKREIKPAVMGVADDGTPIVLEQAMYEPVVRPRKGRRNHFGFLTTDVKAALGDVDFGGYIKTDPNDPESEEALRYDQFIAPLVRAVQELAAEVKAIKGG